MLFIVRTQRLYLIEINGEIIRESTSLENRDHSRIKRTIVITKYGITSIRLTYFLLEPSNTAHSALAQGLRLVCFSEGFSFHAIFFFSFQFVPFFSVSFCSVFFFSFPSVSCRFISFRFFSFFVSSQDTSGQGGPAYRPLADGPALGGGRPRHELGSSYQSSIDSFEEFMKRYSREPIIIRSSILYIVPLLFKKKVGFVFI